MFDQGQHDGGTSINARFRTGGSRGASTSTPILIADIRTEEERFLLDLGFSKPFIAAMKLEALKNATSIEAELLASGQVREEIYYAAFARALGLTYLDDIDAGMLADGDLLDRQLIQPSVLRLTPPQGKSLTALVPRARHAAAFHQRLAGSESLRETMVVVTPSTLRRAVWRSGASRRADASADALFDARPDLSARAVLSGGQGFLAGFLVTAYICCLLLYTMPTLHASHVGLSVTFCILIVLRALAIRRGVEAPDSAPLAEDRCLPAYTVLVALYREREVVPQLIQALLRLDWPRSRLDIKLVCEADDRETIEALRAQDLPPLRAAVEKSATVAAE